MDPCPYCGSAVVLAHAIMVYGPAGKNFGRVYHCARYPECDAYVGVHQGTTVAKGTLANAELRELRMRAHQLFDATWRGKPLSRSTAYARLAERLGIPAEAAHIGRFTVEECRRLIALYGGDAASVFKPIQQEM